MSSIHAWNNIFIETTWKARKDNSLPTWQKGLEYSDFGAHGWSVSTATLVLARIISTKNTRQFLLFSPAHLRHLARCVNKMKLTSPFLIFRLSPAAV
jgi:hypothetical protein